MARWENEDISDLNLPNPETTVISFVGKDGASVDENKAFAKTVTSSLGSQYYIKYGRGEILDPYQIDSLRINGKLFTFKKVSQQAFNLYNRYLNSKNRLYFTRARRLIMEN
ncbi:MAG TPA: hypothetical protein DCS66_22335 [Flavobacteriaceae bacterium]|nr:hypothetical protein [Flavobacteriaceae bacterium]